MFSHKSGPVVKVGVVGHAEWAELARVEAVPDPGQIAHASKTWQEAAGGGGVAAVQLARLNGHSIFLTALGRDATGSRVKTGLEELGVEVHAAGRSESQRRAFVHLDDRGERTITTIGERLRPRAGDPLPWGELDELDAIYFTAGDAGALRSARSARKLVATVRAGPVLAEAGVGVDVLVASANDRGERYRSGDFEPAPTWVVRTDGAHGGTLESADGEIAKWHSRPLARPRVDNYGAGDSFAAGLTFGLGMELRIEDAISLGSFCGAAAVQGRGPYGGQASAAELPAWREAYGITG